MSSNNVKEIRENLLMSKAELASHTGLSQLTVDRVEKGMSCRLETKRKIILAPGFTLSDKEKIFPEAIVKFLQYHNIGVIECIGKISPKMVNPLKDF